MGQGELLLILFIYLKHYKLRLSISRIRPHEHPPALDCLDDGEAGVGAWVGHLLLLHLVPRHSGHQRRLLITRFIGLYINQEAKLLDVLYPYLPLMVRGTVLRPLLRAS